VLPRLGWATHDARQRPGDCVKWPAFGRPRHAEVSAPGVGDGFHPAKVMEVELTEPLPKVSFDGKYRRVWVLGRLHTEPVGCCVTSLGEDGFTPDELGNVLWRELRAPVAERFAAAGLRVPLALTEDGLKASPDASPFLANRSATLADAPPISVVVCTRDRPAQLETCLECLGQQIYPRFEVIVVDNASTGDDVRSLVAGRAGGAIRFRYCRESRVGLSWARNAGIAAAASEIIAFLDDDDQPDRHWLAGIANGFARNRRIGCVTGLVLPARLDTAAQELFEQLGGHCKGRGFTPATFCPSGPQNPLFPLPPFGAGANMAFRRDALVSIGGFDVALGAGTITSAGEDTLALTSAMLSGYEIAYEPAALMWHHHRPDMENLSRQLHGYSVGLTAFYAALIRHRPAVLPGLLKLLPAAARYLKSTAMAPDVAPDLLAGLNRRHLQGLITGPLAYVGSVREQRQVATLRGHTRQIR
jgi:O-antigen biosynthesis protein